MRLLRRAHGRRVDQGFRDAVLEALAMLATGPAGLDDFNPPSYPRDAQSRDLERTGGDMHAVFETFNRESGLASTVATPN